VADLFKNLATEPRDGTASVFESGHKDMREAASDVAIEVLRDPNQPWFLRQQASLLLITNGRSYDVWEHLHNDQTPELMRYAALSSMTSSILTPISPPPLDQERLGLLIIADQLGYINEARANFVSSLSTTDPHVRKKYASEAISLCPSWHTYLSETPADNTQESDSKQIRLADLIRPHSPSSSIKITQHLQTERGALELLVRLLRDPAITTLDNRLIAPEDITFEAKDLAAVDLTNGLRLDDSPYALPTWSIGPRRWRMAVGMLARAAFTNRYDYTTMWRPEITPALRYRGLRSTWFKRRHGMFHRPDGLAGPLAGCSSWFADLLTRLLAWPGAVVWESDSLTGDHLLTPESLASRIEERLEELSQSYAAASRMPVYEHEVRHNGSDDGRLTVAMIQTVRPWQKDFTEFGAELNDPAFRKPRRDHLAGMLRLTEQHLRISASLRNPKDSSPRPQAHVTLLPEVAVHENDLDLIERYVDRTGSAVFCGMVFHRGLPDRDDLVNLGLWIIRDEQASGRSLRRIAQGKQHMTPEEGALNIVGHRPHQVVLRVHRPGEHGFTYRLSGCLCYDATDLNLAADMRHHSDLFVIAANNRDVNTFDAMAGSLNYLMFQHVGIVNTGEFGGTLIHAPHRTTHNRVLTHHHGGQNAAVSVVDLDLSTFQEPLEQEKSSDFTPSNLPKTPPAGILLRRQATQNKNLSE